MNSFLFWFSLEFERNISFFLVLKARIYNNIGTVLEKQGHRKEALKNMESALEIFRECLPPTHPEIAVLYNNIATSYYQIQEYSNALFNYERCFNIQKVSLPPQHPDLVRTDLYMKSTMAIIQQREKTPRQVSKILDRVRCSLPFSCLRNLKIQGSFHIL
jgi:tetratricopeptide (TPR) repeat protein